MRLWTAYQLYTGRGDPHWTDSIPRKRMQIKRLCKLTEQDRYRRAVREILG
jgi:hypothetical protein